VMLDQCPHCGVRHVQATEPRKNKPPFPPIGKVVWGQSAVNYVSRRSRLEEFGGFSASFISSKRPISAPFCRLRESRPSAILGLGAKPHGRQLECAIRPLGTDRVAAPVSAAVRGRVSEEGG
jgi:hypothetical protein